jgi:hypothetical protein
MNKSTGQRSRLRAIENVATAQNVSFPRFVGHAMGTARTEPGANGRFITFKRRLVPDAQAQIDGIEWALWEEKNAEPEPIASFRAPLTPNRDDLAHAFSLPNGWLIEGWTIEETKEAVNMHSNISR